MEGNVLQPFEEGNFRKNELSSMNQDSSSRTRSSSLVEESKPIRARHMTGKQAQDQLYFTTLRPCNISPFLVFTESEVFKNLEIETIYLFETFILCLSVWLYPINVKTAEPIGPKFCVGPHIIPGKVYGCSELQKILFCLLLFYTIHREVAQCSQIEPQLKT